MLDKFGRRILERDDPLRCQANGDYGQCEYEAVENSKYCPRHKGVEEARKVDKKAATMYQLMVWKKRMEELKASPEAKSLGDEVAILRMTLEAVLDRCKTTEDLFMMSSTIGDLALKVEKVTKSCHILEQSSGQLMDKSKAIAFAGVVVEIVDRTVSNFIKDVDLKEKIVDTISKGVLDNLKSTTIEE